MLIKVVLWISSIHVILVMVMVMVMVGDGEFMMIFAGLGKSAGDSS